MALTIHIALDELLEERNMTRYELAKRMGTTYPTINGYYKNRLARYDRDILLKMCLVLQCEPGDIIRLVDDQEDA